MCKSPWRYSISCIRAFRSQSRPRNLMTTKGRSNQQRFCNQARLRSRIITCAIGPRA
jgi:hypothetical protein